MTTGRPTTHAFAALFGLFTNKTDAGVLFLRPTAARLRYQTVTFPGQRLCRIRTRHALDALLSSHKAVDRC
jgi:hypothetical protein